MKAKDKFKNFYSKIKYATIPFFIFVLCLCLSYFGNQLIYNIIGNPGSNYPEIELDKHIPLIPWFVYFYYLTFPLGIITFFYIAYKDKKSLYNIFLTLCISFLISGVIYLVGQTEFVKPDFEPVTFTDKLVVWTWGSVNSINCFPSQHCFMAFAIIIGCLSSKNLNILFRVLAISCSIIIILSTIFIRQHYFLDIIASFDIIFAVWAIVYVFNLGKKCQNVSDRAVQKYKERKNNK